MIDAIGESAGIVWQFLDTQGESSVNKIKNETGLSINDVQRAIGWLAKEDKLNFELKGRVETLSLK
ncbi:winged helix-turn-helix domain-containing protein [Methylomonas paludis]|uniref:Winged helix-turn-helix domain-containing protein n=1 Tax=Methylomonas paludis TaxID=1173101 RepID=A0A975MNQ9_9GAMM|nr:winged helix-turn-helix domain-containing protein [Methylomonas paludis]QWF71182.1 winged helix-turn-helix domain-containing protein [Methylomonas paludis]